MTATMPNQRSTMTFILWTCFALILSTSVQGRTSSVVEIVPSGSVAVKVGEKLNIMCRLGQQLRVCRVVIPGEESMVLTKGAPAEDGVEYYGAGTDSGQCGVQIAKIKESHDGEFKCSLTTTDRSRENSASLRIIVAKPPQNPEIYMSQATHGDGKYRTGDQLEIACVARSGRPAANVSLFLEDEPIGYESRPPSYDTNSVRDNSVAVINATRSVEWIDNGKQFRCVAQHIALDRPKETKRELQVLFAPQPQPPIERFGYEIGSAGIVNVTVFANPRPDFVWHIGDVQIPEGHTDSENRLQTTTSVDMGKGAWAVELKITDVQKSDTEKKYVLEARNGEGAFRYDILLSTSAEPLGVDLDAGSIIGIAVGILVLILVVFLIIFARATGRWCFAGASSSSRNIGESSDTESAGRYSRTEVDGAGSGRRRKPKLTLSKLFKRNVDKVSEADTDTVRTVVTIDEEKVQSVDSATDSHKTNPNDGGIVYAELDLTQRQQGIIPRRINDDKTEYAEIVYTKRVEGEEAASPEKQLTTP